MKKKIVILSFDYELFFGDKSGTVLKTLIEPTNKILDAMDSVGFKGNFFIDWQMLKYLKEENTKRTLSDYNLIKNQLKDMVRRGHRIELHIHPHWVDAKYNSDGTWDFSEFRHYSLNSFSEDEITEMFVEGTNLLESIAREIDSTYKIIAFRAGGWAVQPFEMLKEGFIKAGIKIEASVARGICGKHLHSEYDFRNAPDKGIYRFENDVCTEVVNGAFIEVPITTMKRQLLNRLFDSPYHRFTNQLKCLTDGTHNRSHEDDANQIKSQEGFCMMEFRMCPINAAIYVATLKPEVICFLHHPKDQSKSSCSCIKVLSKVGESLTYDQILKSNKI